MIKLIPIFIAFALLSGCAPKIETVYVDNYITPPVEYLVDTPEPNLVGDDNDALAKHIHRLRIALFSANKDKEKILQWVGDKLRQQNLQQQAIQEKNK